MGLSNLYFAYTTAAQTVVDRSKKGIVALLLEDAGITPGVYPVVNEADIPADLGGDNKAYIKRALTGGQGRPSKVLVSVIAPPEEGDGTETALGQLTGMDYDYVAGPPDADAAGAQALANAVIERRKGNYIGKAVVPNHAADNVGVINFTTDNLVTTGKETLRTPAYCARIAGILAGTPLNCSATSTALPEITAVDELESDAARDEAIDAGQLIAYHDGRKVKLGRAVNSKTTLGADESSILKKIKAVETIDLIHYYAVTTAEDNYEGRCANTYDDKMQLVGALKDFLLALEEEKVLVSSSSSATIDLEAQRTWLKENGTEVTNLTDDQILKADTGSCVFIALAGRIVDAMEDFRIVFTILNN